MQCAALQLYNEEVNDLLSPDNVKLQVHESRENGVYVAGLREEIVTSVEHVLQLLEEGERSRHVGETKMNKNSSRSHSVFRMVSLLPGCFYDNLQAVSIVSMHQSSLSLHAIK
jgi:centromeric protein E